MIENYPFGYVTTTVIFVENSRQIFFGSYYVKESPLLVCAGETCFVGYQQKGFCPILRKIVNSSNCCKKVLKRGHNSRS